MCFKYTMNGETEKGSRWYLSPSKNATAPTIAVGHEGNTATLAKTGRDRHVTEITTDATVSSPMGLDC